MKIKQLEKSGKRAVRMLRRNKLNMGLPFMINSHTLPSGQCYLEYPNGSIFIVTICRKNSDFKVISELSSEEGRSIRKKYKLV